MLPPHQANSLVKSDLDGDLAKPSSAIGMIVAALRERRKNGTPSFTVLSCDNLPENGDKVRRKSRHEQDTRRACVHQEKCLNSGGGVATEGTLKGVGGGVGGKTPLEEWVRFQGVLGVVWRRKVWRTRYQVGNAAVPQLRV